MSFFFSLVFAFSLCEIKKTKNSPHALVARGRARDGQGVALEADLDAVVEPLFFIKVFLFFLDFDFVFFFVGEQKRGKK